MKIAFAHSRLGPERVFTKSVEKTDLPFTDNRKSTPIPRIRQTPAKLSNDSLRARGVAPEPVLFGPRTCGTCMGRGCDFAAEVIKEMENRRALYNDDYELEVPTWVVRSVLEMRDLLHEKLIAVRDEGALANHLERRSR